MSLTRRQLVLAGLFLVMTTLTLVVMSRVLGTVFFAITVAYVLYPIRRELVERGVSRRIAAAVSTVIGFTIAALILAPLVFALYIRRQELLAFLRSIPAEQPIDLFGQTYVVDVSALLARARSTIASVAVDIAGAAPVLALKAFLFVLLVYALLLRPGRVRRATARIVPGEYHDITIAVHERVRDTLYALYILQAATAFGTFVVAYVVFLLLGYDTAFSLAIFSGLLQFIPIVGPSLLIVGIAGFHVMGGQITAAILVTVFGLVLIGFLPDAVIRPRLASITTELPASLYFVGFTGGTLSLGVVGVIAGPLIVALLIEVADLATSERNGRQTTIDDAAANTSAGED
jgi:predicted PurR-regulated permease PerM